MSPELIKPAEEFPLDIYNIDIPDLQTMQDVNGRYLMGGQIAATNSSKVYDAVDGETGERVAFKVYRIVDTEMLGAFIMGSVIGQSFYEQGSEVVRHIESGISQDYDHTFAFTATEKMPGTMADLIKESPDRRLSLGRFATIMLPILEANHDMHTAEIVHADIKPGNSLYTVDEAGIVNGGKLNDFGLSKPESVEPRLLKKYDIPPEAMVDIETQELSPYFMPPEVFMGDSDCTKAGDSFEIAVTAHLALLGKYPAISTPSGTGQRSEMSKVSPPTVADLDNGRVDLPISTLQIIAASCEKNPANRATTAEWIAELKASRYARV